MYIKHVVRFDAVVGDTQVISDIELGPAGVYTLVLTNTNATVRRYFTKLSFIVKYAKSYLYRFELMPSNDYVYFI